MARTSRQIEETTRKRRWLRLFREELRWFEWDSYTHGHVDGDDFEIRRSKNARYGFEILFTIWARDNEDDDPNAEVKPLTVSRSGDIHEDPQELIRSMVHWWICHEADERLFFGPAHERPFYPHDAEGRTITV